jgi:phage shock protein E
VPKLNYNKKMIELFKKIFGAKPQVNLADLVKEGAIILDVRTKGEFESGHIKGAVNIPLDKLQANINKFKSKQKPIITCCASGTRSASAKSILQSKGFETVINGGSWTSLERKL